MGVMGVMKVVRGGVGECGDSFRTGRGVVGKLWLYGFGGWVIRGVSLWRICESDC